ncbi:hypothetical protein ACS0TY_025835 [Phlomoides rotata]
MLNSHQESDALFCEEDDTVKEESSFLDLFGMWDCDEDDDDEEINSLLQKEQECQLYNGNTCLSKGREEAVEWMLRVIGHYSFSALTAVLAVNYFDRFIHAVRSDHTEKPWMSHLAAVSCLSLAAKFDEIHVPLLLDLQVEEPKYVFEAKNIKRMEILVLSTLQWKMNPVTPLSFLDYFTRRIALKFQQICCGFITRCERLILSLISDSRFMGYLPSALASATMLFVITSLNPGIGLEYQDQLVAILGINKEKVHDCCVLIQEVATIKKRNFGCLPRGSSPKGVFDASFTSDNSNDSWALISPSSSPEPLFKKIKTQQNPNTTQFSEP